MGFFPSLRAMQEAHHALLRRQREAGAARSNEILNAIEKFIRTGRETGCILSSPSDQAAAQGLLDYWATVLYREHKESPLALLADYDPNAAREPELEERECPYVGMRSFEETDSDVFFGRDKLVHSMIQLVEMGNFAAVVGSSNSGRSSLVRAGLLGALARGVLPGSEAWPVEDTPPLCGQFKTLTNEPTSVIVIDDCDDVFALCSEQDQQKFAADVLELADTPGIRRIIVVVLRSDYENQFARLPELQARIQQAQVRALPPTAKQLREAIERPAEIVGLKFDDGVVEDILGELIGESAVFALLQFTLRRLWRRRVRSRITREAYNAVGAGRRAMVRAAEAFFQRLSPHERELARLLLVRLGSTEQRVAASWSALLESTGNRADAEALLHALQQEELIKVVGRAPREKVVKLAHEALVEDWDLLAGWLDEERADVKRRQRLDAKASEWVRLGRRHDAGLLSERELLEAEEWLESPTGRRISANDDVHELVDVSHAVIRSRRQRQIRRWQAFAAFLSAVVIVVVILASYAFEQERRAKSAESDARLQNAVSGLFAIELQKRDLQARANERETFASTLRPSAGFASKERRDEILRLIEIVGKEAKDALEEVETLSGARRRTISEIDRYNAEKWGQMSASDKQQTLADVLQLIPREKSSSHSDHRRLLTALYAAAAIPESNAQLNEALRDAIVKTHQRGRLRSPPQVWAVAFSPEEASDLAAVGDNFGVVKIWKPPAQDPPPNELSRVSGEIVNGLAFSADGKMLAAAYRAAGAVVWRLGKPNERAPIDNAPGRRFEEVCPLGVRADAKRQLSSDPVSARIYDVAFTPDAKFLAIASSDRAAHLWALSEPGCPQLQKQFAHEDEVFGVAVSPDGKLLATASGDKTVAVWKLAPRGGPERYRTFTVGKPMFAVAFSPDSRAVAASGADERGYVWRIETEQRIDLPKHIGRMLGRIAYSPDGKLVATAGDDHAAIVADAQTGAEIDRFWHEREVFGIGFSRDSKSLLTGSLDGTARVWTLGFEAIPAAADRTTLMALGSQQFADTSLKPEECDRLLKLSVPVFAAAKKNWQKSEYCPLPFLEPESGEAP